MRLLLALLGVVILGILAAELVMQPSMDDRIALIAIFGFVAVVTALGAVALRRLTTRMRSLHRAVLLVALGTVGAAALAVGLSARLMFISAHDLRLVLIALALGVGLGIVIAATVSRPLAADLERIGATAERVAGGDLSARTGVDRPDEVGEAARALDSMVLALSVADEERRRSDQARRQFLAAISHDLRTPLTALQAAVEALEDGLVDDPDRYLQAMERDIEALRNLVDDLFFLARIEAGDLQFEPQPVDLAELADEAAEALAPVADRRGVELSMHVEGSARVRGSSRELGRAIRNVLDNAIRFAPPSSRVDIFVSARNDMAAVEVVDSGPGFPPEFAEGAFDAFAKADSSRTGAGRGLGLAITRGVVEAHDGEVWISQGPGGRVGLRIPSVA